MFTVRRGKITRHELFILQKRCHQIFCCIALHNLAVEFAFKVNEIRELIEKISADVDEVKKKQSTILAAPQTDDSMHNALIISAYLAYFINDLIISINILWWCWCWCCW